MTKKFLCIIITCIIAISVCSCGKTAKDSDGVPTLIWYVPGDSQKDMPEVMKAANKIIEKKIGAKLDLKMIDESAFSEKMSMKMASNEVFDLCFTGYINQYKPGVDVGGFLELTELINKYGKEMRKELPDYVFDSAKEQGGIYAVPNMQVMANVEGIFFFEDIAQKYGIKEGMEFKNITELEPYFEEIKKNEKNVYPICNGAAQFYLLDYTPVNQNPTIYIKNDAKPGDKLQLVYDMDEYKQGLETTKRWYDKGYIRPDVDTAANNKTEDLRAGRYASFQGRWKPGIENDHKSMYGRKTVFVSSGHKLLTVARDTMTAVSSTSKNPEKAMQLLNLVNTDKELYNIICYGLEGKHYEKLDGEYIRLIENSGYSQLACWKFGNQFNAYLLEGQEPDIWKQTKALNDSASRATSYGFSFDENGVKSEEAQCAAVVGEYSSLGNGSGDYEKLLPECRKRLKNAGVDVIIDAAQKQLDDWFKNNK